MSENLLESVVFLGLERGEGSPNLPLGNSFDGRLCLWIVKSGNAQAPLVVSMFGPKPPET